MHAINHRLEHLHTDLAGQMLRLVLRMFSGFGASWDRLLERNAARAGKGDDILWDDGEPD